MFLISRQLFDIGLYLFCFCAVFYITFLVLQATRLEECFKKGKVWQIKIAYLFICIITGHIVTTTILYICSLLSSF